jgi:hypothetical protein
VFVKAHSLQLDVFRSRSGGTEADRDIAARAWDLEEVDGAYAHLLETYQPQLAAYRAGELQGVDALVERMNLIHSSLEPRRSDVDPPATCRASPSCDSVRGVPQGRLRRSDPPSRRGGRRP